MRTGGQAHEVDEDVRGVISSTLATLEEAALDEACPEFPEEVREAMQQTISYVSKHRSPESEGDWPWACLGDLLCSSNPVNARIGASWLLRLLSVAALNSLNPSGPLQVILSSARGPISLSLSPLPPCVGKSWSYRLAASRVVLWRLLF
jgi:hypothetical protein